MGHTRNTELGGEGSEEISTHTRVLQWPAHHHEVASASLEFHSHPCHLMQCTLSVHNYNTILLLSTVYT